MKRIVIGFGLLASTSALAETQEVTSDGQTYAASPAYVGEARIVDGLTPASCPASRTVRP